MVRQYTEITERKPVDSATRWYFWSFWPIFHYMNINIQARRHHQCQWRA